MGRDLLSVPQVTSQRGRLRHNHRMPQLLRRMTGLNRGDSTSRLSSIPGSVSRRVRRQRARSRHSEALSDRDARPARLGNSLGLDPSRILIGSYVPPTRSSTCPIIGLLDVTPSTAPHHEHPTLRETLDDVFNSDYPQSRVREELEEQVARYGV